MLFSLFYSNMFSLLIINTQVVSTGINNNGKECLKKNAYIGTRL